MRFTVHTFPPQLLLQMLKLVPPKSTVLELGSGDGTVHLARFYRVHSIEHDPWWVDRCETPCIHAPIRDGWYDVEALRRGLAGLAYGAILIDGPPGTIGRGGFLTHLDLFDTAVPMFFDDTHRPAERELIAAVAAGVGRPCKLVELTYGPARGYGWISSAEPFRTK